MSARALDPETVQQQGSPATGYPNDGLASASDRDIVNGAAGGAGEGHGEARSSQCLGQAGAGPGAAPCEGHGAG